MPLSKPVAFELDDHQATVDAIAKCMQPSAEKLTLDMYTSIDMCTSISTAKLIEHMVMLLALMTLDPRGGYFGPKQFMEATTIALEGRKAEFMGECLKLAMPHAEGIATVAYYGRIMLAHPRIKFDSSGDDCKKEFEEVFAIMKNGSKGAQVSPKKTRRKERLACRPCPFINFRTDETEPANDTEEEEDAEVVSRRFDWGTGKAVMLYTDGVKKLADTYIDGGKGFCTAVWLHDNST